MVHWVSKFSGFFFSTPLRIVLSLFFTKVVFILVSSWPIHAVKITLYLDGAFGFGRYFARCQVASTFVSLHFCRLVSFPLCVNTFDSLFLAWYGWDFVLICPVAIFPFPQR